MGMLECGGHERWWEGGGGRASEVVCACVRRQPCRTYASRALVHTRTERQSDRSVGCRSPAGRAVYTSVSWAATVSRAVNETFPKWPSWHVLGLLHRSVTFSGSDEFLKLLYTRQRRTLLPKTTKKSFTRRQALVRIVQRRRFCSSATGPLSS